MEDDAWGEVQVCCLFVFSCLQFACFQSMQKLHFVQYRNCTLYNVESLQMTAQD